MTSTSQNTAAIFINQIRQKIGVMFGNPETTSGGLVAITCQRYRAKCVSRPFRAARDAVEQVKVKVVKNKELPFVQTGS